MISIKRFIEERRKPAEPDASVHQAALEMARQLLDGIATYMLRERAPDCAALRQAMSGLAERLHKPQSVMSLLSVSSDAIEAMEIYSQGTTEYLREENEQMQSMVSMLTATVAELSGQTDASVGRLQAIEMQIDRVSGLDDMRTLRANLETCLVSVREAAAEQRSSSASTVQRLRSQIEMARIRVAPSREPARFRDADLDAIPDPPEDLPEPVARSYVAAVKLKRAEQIARRFGEEASRKMLAVIGSQLKSVLEPGDRILRWKGTSLVVFLNTAATIQDVRARLAAAVAATGQQYIEVGRKSALLAVGADWIVFPQAQCPSIDAVFAEVDTFLANGKTVSPAASDGQIPRPPGREEHS